MELFRGNAGRNESIRRLIVEESGNQRERLIDKPQAIEHHGFDRLTYREVAHFRVVVSGLVDDVAKTESCKHASYKPERISGLRAVQWRLGREVRAIRGSHRLLLCSGECIDTSKYLNDT